MFTTSWFSIRVLFSSIALSLLLSSTLLAQAPLISNLSPNSVVVGSPDFLLTVNGASFLANSQIQWNGVALLTVFVSDSQLTTTIPAADLVTAQPVNVLVNNPGVGNSNTVSFLIANPIPSITSISPNQILRGSSNFTLTVTGTNFINGAGISWNGSSRPTVFVTSAELRATISAADLTTAELASITVSNPAPGGGSSNSVPFEVNNPLPSISSISPNSRTVSGPTFTLSVTGGNFVPESTIQWNGENRTSVFVSATSLTAQIPYTDIAALGAVLVRVSNPSPGGGISNEVPFYITPSSDPMGITTPSLPNAAALSPYPTTTLQAAGGSPAYTWSIISAPGTFPSGLNLNPSTGVISGTPTRGGAYTFTLQVRDAASTTSSKSFTISITNPNPSITGINPASILIGSSDFDLVVTGSNLVENAQVTWNGVAVANPTVWVNPTQVRVTIPASYLTTAGSASVTVVNPTTTAGPPPDGGTSNALPFSINNPVPAISSLSQSAMVRGSPGFTLTVNGSGFVSNSVVRWGGSNRATSFVGTSQLTATILDADLATAGTVALSVFNPLPGGGSSNTVNFTVNNPAPTLATLAPNSVIAGSGGFTLTIDGTEFVSGAVVRWNGSNRPTTFINAAQITAAIPSSDIATAGTFNITVINPAPNLGPSTALVFTVNNPVPAISVLSPASNTAGGAAFTLTVNGSNFVATSLVRWNGVARTTTFVNSSQVTAVIQAADITAAGTANITVFNPAPGGGESAAATFTINNPLPVISGLSQNSALIGSSGFTVTVSGSYFVSGSVVRWNGSDRATTFINNSQLTAALPDSDFAVAGVIPVTVFNPPPNGGASNAVTFTVNNPVPLPSSLTPNATLAGSAGFTLTVDGSNFVSGAVIRWNGSDRPTTFINTSRITAAISPADIALAGIVNVTVLNPTPNLGPSATWIFTINNPVPVLSTLLPAEIIAGGSAFTLTVNGSNFVSTSVVRWQGADRTTTFVNASQLTALITASDVAAGGLNNVTVFNPAPGGGESNAVTFIKNNPLPAIAALSPNSIAAGGSAFTLTVTGSNFVSSSIVRWQGSNRLTNFVSASQLTASLSAADIASAGSSNITVYNPAPGGGESSPVSFSINSPVPALTNLSPASLLVGSGDFTLTITGTSFVSASIVRWNGSPIANPPSLLDSTHLTIIVPAALVSNSGTASVTVFNPSPGGGESNALTFTINNPAPVITNLLPASIFVGSSQFVLTVNGNNFVPGAIINWNGSPRTPTTWTSASQLTVSISSIDLASAGTVSITVVNPSPSLNPSNSAVFTIENPFPTLSSLSSSSTLAGSPGFVLTLTGSNFVSSSTVRWNGLPRSTTFINSSQLTAQIPSSDLTSGGTVSLSVFNATPGGGESTTLPFTINNPVPTLFSLAPSSAGTGSPNLALTVTGTSFVSSSVVRWNGSPRSTVFASSSQLTAQITSADLATAGTANVTVFNPAPGGGESASTTFTVNNSLPAVTSLSPASIMAGNGDFLLTVNGNNFISGSSIRWNGTALTNPTNFVNSTQVTVTIPAVLVTTAGAVNITVFNPGSGGGESNALSFSINNPVPSLSSLSPLNAAAGTAGLSLTASGTNFVPGSVIRWNGLARATTLQNSTQLTAQITAADLIAAGTATVTVFNPAPGGGESNTITFTINNPVPTLAGLAPSSAGAGSPNLTLTLTGTNFVSNSVVRWGGSPRSTTFVNSSQLTAQITSADLAAAGTANVTVFNPAPGGGESASATFTINNSLPVVTALSPVSTLAGSGDFLLAVNGNNFISGSSIRGNGASLANPTNFISSTQLTVTVPAALVATAGTVNITVFNPGSGGGESNALGFSINNPVPSLSSLSPLNGTAGTPGLTLTATGTNFVPGSALRWNGSARATTFQNSTQLTAQITTADLITAGTATVTIFNPAPGGGESNTIPFTINNPVPTLASLAPTSIGTGSPNLALTLTGTHFVSTSVVRWNGSPRSTTFVSSSQLTAQIVSADLATAGTATVTVFNPSPAGGESATVVFTISSNGSLPNLSVLSPASVLAGSNLFTLTVSGNNFISGSVIRWNGTAVTNPTSFIDATQLTVTIPAAYVAAAGTATISVYNPGQGGGESNSLTFKITNPSPVLSSISPSSTMAGGSSFILSLTGSNFMQGAVVHWNGSPVTPTTWLSATQISVSIPSSSINLGGAAEVTVLNPQPSEASNSLTFTINNPLPVLTKLSASKLMAGSPGTLLTLYGSNFVPTSVAQWNGAARATHFISSTQLTAEITASDVSITGTGVLTVFNPVPVGGTSNSLTIMINPGVSINATFPPFAREAGAGVASFTLTRTGDTNQSLDISLKAIGTAAARSDYQPLPDHVTIPAGASSLSLNVIPIDDLQVEEVETVVAMIQSSPAYILEAPGSAVIYILDNDSISRVSIYPLNPIAHEAGARSATMAVIRSGNTSSSLRVPYRLSGTATPGVDYQDLPGFVDIEPGSSWGFITITPVDDHQPEGWETVVATLLPEAGYSLIAPASSTIYIQDDNPPPETPPVISSIAPNRVPAATNGFFLTVTGSGYLPGISIVEWNRETRATWFISSRQLVAYISAHDVIAPGTAAITVLNLSANGQRSNELAFTIAPPGPPPPLQIISQSPLPGAVFATSYSFAFGANGGKPPYAWNTAGTLPEGLQFDRDAGILSGTPIQLGKFTFTVLVTDAASTSVSDSFEIQVNPQPLEIITPSPLEEAVSGTAYLQVLQGTGGIPPYSWTLLSGTLPRGLSLDSLSGAIQGISVVQGDFSFTIQLKDSNQAAATGIFQINSVLPPLPPVQMSGLSPTLQPAQQPKISLKLASPFPLPLSGELRISFADNAEIPGDDPTIQFVSGSRSIEFNIPANTLEAVFPDNTKEISMQTGTTAGDITVETEISWADGDLTPSPSPRLKGTLDRSVPKVHSLEAGGKTASTFQLTVVGYSTPKSITQVVFKFIGKPGSNLQTTTVALDVASLFTNWYQSPAGKTLGSQFKLMVPFTVQGDLNGLNSVSVILRNTVGSSEEFSVVF